MLVSPDLASVAKLTGIHPGLNLYRVCQCHFFEFNFPSISNGPNSLFHSNLSPLFSLAFTSRVFSPLNARWPYLLP